MTEEQPVPAESSTPAVGPEVPSGRPPHRGPSAQNADRDRGGPRRQGGRSRFYARRKVCQFCVNHTEHIDYKDISTLKRYLSDQAKIESRRKSGTCSKHQRDLATAIKRARYLALIPIDRTHLMP